MKKVLITYFSFLVIFSFGHAAPEEEYPIKNESCDGCILVAVIGHGVAEGHEGRYHFPADYTLEKFWIEKPVPLYLPHDRIYLTRRNDAGKEERYIYDARKAEAEDAHPPVYLHDGDTIFVSQPII